MEKEGLFACCIPPVHSHSKQKNIKNKTKQTKQNNKIGEVIRMELSESG